jgi:hypothetical protein
MRSVLLLLFVAAASGATCLPYNKTVTITGTLARVDENGYRQWIALRPERPVCTVADPKDETTGAESDITEMQVLLADRQELRGRAGKLIGHKVKIQGTLQHAVTGYHRTAVMIGVQNVDALDARGAAALRAPDPKVPLVEDLPAYDIVIHAAERLRKEAVESGSGRQLTPADAYAPHWVNGGDDILYINCRDGYDLTPDGVSCEPTPAGCAVGVEDRSPVTVRIHCVRRK